MAKEIAKLDNSDFLSISPEAIKDLKSTKKLMENLNHSGYDASGNRVGAIKPSILLLDEIHKLPLAGQEALGIAMENYMLETGRANKFYWLPYFTLIGATTMAGELSKPFLDRFKMSFTFEPYSISDSFKIVKAHCSRLSIAITSESVATIAKRGRGIPRIMVKYLEMIRDFTFAKNSKVITLETTLETFRSLGIDVEGFSLVEIKILKTLYEEDKPVGLENLAIIVGESAKTLKETIEPYLIQRGFILRSGSGRLITRLGKEYIDKQNYVNTKTNKINIPANYVRQ